MITLNNSSSFPSTTHSFLFSLRFLTFQPTLFISTLPSLLFSYLLTCPTHLPYSFLSSLPILVPPTHSLLLYSFLLNSPTILSPPLFSGKFKGEGEASVEGKESYGEGSIVGSHTNRWWFAYEYLLTTNFSAGALTRANIYFANVCVTNV